MSTENAVSEHTSGIYNAEYLEWCTIMEQAPTVRDNLIFCAGQTVADLAKNDEIAALRAQVEILKSRDKLAQLLEQAHGYYYKTKRDFPSVYHAQAQYMIDTLVATGKENV